MMLIVTVAVVAVLAFSLGFFTAGLLAASSRADDLADERAKASRPVRVASRG